MWMSYFLLFAGQFARVFGGFLLDENFENPARVAVKTLRCKCYESLKHFWYFLIELIMITENQMKHVCAFIRKNINMIKGTS